MYSWKNKGFIPFPRGISPKVNVIDWLEFKITHFEATVKHLSHCTMGTPHFLISQKVLNIKIVIRNNDKLKKRIKELIIKMFHIGMQQI